MKDFDPIREFVFDYITVVAQNTLAIAIIGSIFAKNVAIDYRYFFLPFVLGIVCMIPCLPVYLKEDISLRGVVIQRIVELVVLVVVIILAAYFVVGDNIGRAGYVAIVVSVVLSDLLCYFLKWYLEKSEVDRVNKRLTQLRARREKK